MTCRPLHTSRCMDAWMPAVAMAAAAAVAKRSCQYCCCYLQVMMLVLILALLVGPCLVVDGPPAVRPRSPV
jgi:hypothetical protein